MNSFQVTVALGNIWPPSLQPTDVKVEADTLSGETPTLSPYSFSL